MRTNILRALFCVAVAAVPSACGDITSEYSSYPCRFVFNMNTHATSAALLSAVSSPGIFCKVSKVYKSGAYYYYFQTNQGLSDYVIFTSEDTRTTVSLGMNNAIYVGYGTTDYPSVFYGFDAECPNCFDPDAVPVRSKALSVSTAGIATCSTCQRTYDMNNGGIVASGDDGDKLTRYHASYSAAGIVSVTN